MAFKETKFSLGEMLASMQPEDQDDAKLFGPPLDYSFKEIRKMSEVSATTPRDGTHPYVTIAVSLAEEESANVTKSREKADQSSEESLREPIKYCSKAIRLSSNSIGFFEGFSRAIQSVIEMPDTLEWIDLSFNVFTKISEDLLEYKNLKVLYLHGNYVDDITQVDKLASLPQLKTLTLHGNVIDEVKGYRQYVITALPLLQFLDFSKVTRADRDKAVTWRQLKIIGHHRKKKKKIEKE